MAVADVIVLTVVVFSCLYGILRGLVKEALSLFFWVAAGVLAVSFNEVVGGWLRDFITNAAARKLAAIALIVVVTIFGGGLVANLISKATSAIGLGGADRALGALFGLIRGVLVVTVLAVLLGQFEAGRQWYDDALSVPYLLSLADYLGGLLGIDPGALRPGPGQPV